MLKIFVYIHHYQYYQQFFFKGIFIYGPTKLSQTEIVLPTCQLNDLTYLIKMTYLKDQW